MKQHITIPPLQNILITDPLFGRYVDMVAEKLIPYQWKILNDQIPGIEKSYCMENFRAAAGKQPGMHRGMVFCDTDLYKWIETLGYCLAAGHAKDYEPFAEEAIALIAASQEEDGYLNTYYTLNCPDKKWTNLVEGHELYSGGHLIEAAISYYQATGRTQLLDVACRFADLTCRIFGADGLMPDGCPGHQEIELALMKLYEITQNRSYAELAKHFLDVRGNASGFLLKNLKQQGKDRIFPEFADYDAGYAQSHLPPKDQTTAEGHAVRAMYMYSAMADVAKTYGDDALKKACAALWKNVTGKRMYITGGIGSSGHLERFTTDYDLPNDRMYCESCASVGLMMFGQRMNKLTGDAGYYDVVERALCNTVLAGISAGGDRYFYVNPLEIWPANCLPGTSMAHVKPVRQPWFSCACCPSNIARTLASLGQYIYAQDGKSVYINQFISSQLHTSIKSTELDIKLENALLHTGKACITIQNSKAVPVTVRIRIPEYLKEPSFVFSGTAISPHIENGYAVVAVSQEGEQLLEISGRVEPEWVAANDSVRADIGKVALQLGPFVYCLEETDNGGSLPEICVHPDEPVSACEGDAQLPGNLPRLHFNGKRVHSGIRERLYAPPAFSLSDTEVNAVPYALWGNRTPGEMLVWLRALV